MDGLVDKIENKTACIGVIGLGYVGLPLAIAFAEKFKVYGYDNNEKVISCLGSGSSHIMDVDNRSVLKCLNKSFHPTSSYHDLKKCDFIIICVPTPLTDEKYPDISYIRSACEIITKILRKNQFVILESTTYPCTTENIVLPILETSNLKAGDDFGLAFSPERIDPGNLRYNIKNTPKIVGGIDGYCTDVSAKLYETIVERVIKVSDTKSAEAVKMVENIFRNVNIALVNEMSLIFERMGINSWEIINAASTKPYGYMAFYPGPGVGGHCIPLDPFYMSYISKKYGLIPRFIEISGEINEFMKLHAVNLIECGLSKKNKKIFTSTIAVMGLAYKKNINDTRESPSIKIIDELVNIGASLKVFDPFIDRIQTKSGIFISEKNIEDALRNADAAIFLIDHDIFKSINLKLVSRLMATPIIVDCKNLFSQNDDIIYLGIGKGHNYHKP